MTPPGASMAYTVLSRALLILCSPIPHRCCIPSDPWHGRGDPRRSCFPTRARQGPCGDRPSRPGLPDSESLTMHPFFLVIFFTQASSFGRSPVVYLALQGLVLSISTEPFASVSSLAPSRRRKCSMELPREPNAITPSY